MGIGSTKPVPLLSQGFVCEPQQVPCWALLIGASIYRGFYVHMYPYFFRKANKYYDTSDNRDKNCRFHKKKGSQIKLLVPLL